MAAIYPVATTRISNALIHARLVSQFDFDQHELLRIQDQVSTGFRISTPSQDAPAATRAIVLQRLLEQKRQALVNLNTTDSFVNATDTSLIGATELLSHVKALALRAVDSTTTPEQRETLRSEVQNAVDQFLDIGNRQFRGRYLYGGSNSAVQPFEKTGQFVAYNADETSFNNFIDVDVLSEMNITGAEAFGAISAEVIGTGNLVPVVTESTRLSDLRGGRGITLGSFVISDGSSSQTVDISQASTVGDVMELITQGAPTGRQLHVTLSGASLIIDLDDGGGGNLTVREVSGGATATELGILNSNGAGVAPLVGTDLHPALQLTTRLRDVLGTRASVRATFSALHDDLLITAVRNGADYNNTQVQFVPGAVGDQAVASYDAGANILTVQISPGVTRAATAVSAINLTGVFTAELDLLDDHDNDGSDVLTTATFATAGGSGEALNQSSGLQISNGGELYNVTFNEAESIEDLLNILNRSDARVYATINADKTGIDVRSRLSGSDFMIGENGGNTATQLGIRSLTAATYLNDLNYGAGVSDDAGIDLTIQRRDGVVLRMDLAGAETVGDVIDRINSDPANVGNAVVARLARTGNGIELEDAYAGGTQNLTVFRGSSFAAWELGLVPRNQDQFEASITAPGTPQVITGRDVQQLEADGVFNSLIRLDQALQSFDLGEIARAAAKLDDNFVDLTFVQAKIGTKARSISNLKDRIEREQIDIESTLSIEIETDLVQAISELTARQANLQATLQLIGSSLQLTVLNYL